MNKRENYLLEILGAIIKRYGSQLTWNALAGDLSIDHPKTVADYIEVKWTRQLRPKQLKQIVKYPNGRILTRSKVKGEIHGVSTEPLPLALLRLGELQ